MGSRRCVSSDASWPLACVPLTDSSVASQQNASGREGKWDIAVFQERAKERDKEAYERAKEAEEAMKQGASVPLGGLPCLAHSS